MTSCAEQKANLRAEVLAQRDALSAEVRAQKSAEICEELEQLLKQDFAARNPTAHTPRVAVYASMRSEVDVWPFVRRAFNRGWQVAFPCMVRDNASQPSRMAFYLVQPDRVEYAREAFLSKPLRCLTCAALENDGFEPCLPSTFDAVMVPLVAFDDTRNRLGYGGGNYDQFIPQLRIDALVVGVAFAEQRVEMVPTECHDQPLPHIVIA